MTHPGARTRRLRGATESGGGGTDATTALREVATLILGQLSLIAALAYYFGRTWTGAWLDHFGLSTSLVDFSTTDYVVRSIGLSYWPLMGLGLLIVIALFVDPLVRTRWDGMAPSKRKALLASVALVCVAMLASAALGLFQVWIYPESIPAIPLLMAGTVALATYMTILHPTRQDGRALLHKAQFVALAGLLAASIFWAWGSYAGNVGASDAAQTARDLPFRPEATVFSAQRLGLAGHGIAFDPYGDGESLYHYRYTGLRLLLRSGERYFLLPKDWQRGRDPVFILSESENVRIQFVAPPYPP